jgi:hypothetical protein
LPGRTKRCSGMSRRRWRSGCRAGRESRRIRVGREVPGSGWFGLPRRLPTQRRWHSVALVNEEKVAKQRHNTSASSRIRLRPKQRIRRASIRQFDGEFGPQFGLPKLFGEATPPPAFMALLGVASFGAVAAPIRPPAMQRTGADTAGPTGWRCGLVVWWWWWW